MVRGILRRLEIEAEFLCEVRAAVRWNDNAARLFQMFSRGFALRRVRKEKEKWKRGEMACGGMGMDGVGRRSEHVKESQVWKNYVDY